MAARLVAQRNRNVTGDRPRRLVLWRDHTEQQQVVVRAGQFGTFEKHRVLVADQQQTAVRAGGDLQIGRADQRGRQRVFKLRAYENPVSFFSFSYPIFVGI